MLVEDYDPVIELMNSDVVDDPELYVSKHDLDHNNTEDDDFTLTSEEVDNQDLDPQVIVDFEDKEKRYMGEQWWLKILKVCFYNTVATFLTTVLIIGYMQLVVDFFSLESVPALEVIISIIIMISSVHFSLRLSSFLNLDIMDWDHDSDFNSGVYNFAFSFNMSILTLWIITFFTFMIVKDGTQDPVLGPEQLLTVVGVGIVISVFFSLVGEILIRKGDIPDELVETKRRSTAEFEINDESDA